MKKLVSGNVEDISDVVICNRELLPEAWDIMSGNSEFQQNTQYAKVSRFLVYFSFD